MYQIDFQHPIHIHFIGIGGISMSGLAEILLQENFRISGSDAKSSELTEKLERLGAEISFGQRAGNITEGIGAVVYTAAIHPDNPELKAAVDRGIPTLTRAELLGQIMGNYGESIAISGTHGKTTTTSMVSEILLMADTDPTLSVGGILRSIGGNMRIGGREYFVTEACEYTNSFLSFSPRIGVILNIDEDHLDFFKDLDDIRHSFRRYAQLLPADGCLIINGEIPHLEEITQGLECSVITFGGSPACDYHPLQTTYNQDGCACFSLQGKGRSLGQFTLQVPGEHNLYNALAAAALADLLSIDTDVIRDALYGFRGTDRRFEHKGDVGGVTVIDDYAHHPTEIRATLSSAANIPHSTLWCVFQPHTYSRTKTFMKEFAQALSLADKVVLTEIFPARETDTLGISSRDLQQEIRALGQECFYFSTFDEVENFLLKNCIKGDMLITMGAGDVHKIGENLLGT